MCSGATGAQSRRCAAVGRSLAWGEDRHSARPTGCVGDELALLALLALLARATGRDAPIPTRDSISRIR
jgi:hypothetical protein